MKNPNNLKNLVFLLLFSCALYSYKNSEAHTGINKQAGVNRGDIIGRKVIMPDTVEIYSPFKKDSIVTNSQPPQVKPFKIYAYVNVSCPTCIVDLQNWQEFISELNSEVPVIMVCTSKDHFEYFKYLCEGEQLKHFTFPLYLDIKNQFATRNPFVNESLAYQTVLTNSDNTILVSGDPIHSEITRKLYMDEINKPAKTTLKQRPGFSSFAK